MKWLVSHMLVSFLLLLNSQGISLSLNMWEFFVCSCTVKFDNTEALYYSRNSRPKPWKPAVSYFTDLLKPNISHGYFLSVGDRTEDLNFEKISSYKTVNLHAVGVRNNQDVKETSLVTLTATYLLIALQFQINMKLLIITIEEIIINISEILSFYTLWAWIWLNSFVNPFR